MVSLLQRAWLYLNLTPAERALLRFGETLLAGAVLAGLQAIMPVLVTGNFGAINWNEVLHTFLAAFVMALYLGISKYFKAHTDPTLPELNPEENSGG